MRIIYKNLYSLHINLRTYSKQIHEMKFLNVAEKHDAAKTISNILSKGTAKRREGYSKFNKVFDFESNIFGGRAQMVMTSVSGHLLQLEFLSGYRNWRSVDPISLFDAPVRKSCSKDYQPIKRTLEREIRGCKGLIIWTDCDREGENIGHEIIDVCRAVKSNITVHRAIFSELTDAALKRALQRLGTPDKPQSDAVDVRTELDLRTGAALTRFQTMRFQRLFPEKIADHLISYGSCQIPTLGFVVERYKEIEAFISEPFWKIKVTHTIEDLTVEFLWARNRLFDKQACEDYLILCLANPKATVESVKVKPKNKWRPTPLDTVEMEKLASRKLKMSAKEAMTIAEKLYTKGLISYPRTETNQFSKDFDLCSLVQQQTEHPTWGGFAQRVLEWGPNPRNGNKSDQAHPPIHPTKLVTNLDESEAKIYELIVRHFLACVSRDGVGSETVVNIDIAGEKFHANGLCIYERNYLDVYIYEKWNAKEIHKYEENQIFEPTEISMPEGATTAPPLLTEADLIALMEKHGIGTDATHAEHINTIKERGYIGVVDKGALVPGVIGMGLYEGYNAMELELTKPLLRAGFEADLKLICMGQKDPKQVLLEQILKYKEAYKKIMEKVKAMDEKLSQRLNETPKIEEPNDNENEQGLNQAIQYFQELLPCPKCKMGSLALKPKKQQIGHFIGCLNFPDCQNAIWLPLECKEYKVLDEHCIKCGPQYKLLKFKFSSAYYRSVFNTPLGWYKTCLCCDEQFRNTFNINLDLVKSVGFIVDDSQNRNFRPSTGPVANRKNVGKKTKEIPTQNKQNLSTKCAKETTINTGASIRKYCTGAASNRQILEEQLHNVPVDEFFNSNDSFEEAIMSIEINTQSAGVTHESSGTVFNDDIAAAFANDDADDADLANLEWGTNATTRPTTSTRNNRNIQRTLNYDVENNYDNIRWGSAGTNNSATSAFNNSSDRFSNIYNQNDESSDNYAWGTKARGKSTKPMTKRPRLNDDKDGQVPRFYDDDSFYDISWGSGSLRETQTTNIKCSGCHQPAKILNVKRDGPNKGRQFFSCSKSKPCKFFQWVDENNSSILGEQHYDQSSNHRRDSNSWGTRGLNTSTYASPPTASVANQNSVQCNCGRDASNFTVRKDGPNKGRPFYSCHNRDKSCGFFQWADDQNNEASTSNWGSKQKQQNSSSFVSNKANNERKCSLCRQAGHTKAKCVRNSKFKP